MGIFDWFSIGKNKVEHPPKEFTYLQQLGLKSKVLPLNYLDWYKTNPFVFAAINERAKACSNAKFYELTPDGERLETPLTEKLNKPNDYQSKEDFLKQFITFLSIWGTGYIYINKLRPSTPLEKIEIINLPTNRVQFPDIADIDMYYNILTFSKKEPKVIYKTSEMAYKELDINNLLPIFDTVQYTNLYYSESRLRALQYAVSNTQAAFESQNTFLSNPGGMGMLVKRAKEMQNPILTEDERKELEKSMQNDYGTLTGQRNIQIAGVDVDYISLMADVKKLALNETMTNNGLIIFGSFDLPKELLTAIQQGSTFENQKEAYKRYLQSAGQDLISNIASTLDSAFLGESENTLIASFDHLPIMQEDEKLKAEVGKIESETMRSNYDVYTSMFDRGLINEQELKQKLEL